MNTSYLETREKPGIFQLTYQLHNSSADCAGELFKPSKSKDLAGLRVCNENKDFWVSFFMSDFDQS